MYSEARDGPVKVKYLTLPEEPARPVEIERVLQRLVKGANSLL
jgi:hypothetical protein